MIFGIGKAFSEHSGGKMAGRGGGGYTPEQGGVVKTHKQILDELDESERPAFAMSDVEKLCAAVHGNPERLGSVRALVRAITMKDTRNRITTDQVTDLFGCKCWPEEFEPIDADTIGNFANKGMNPKSELTVATYLMALSLLYRAEHPAFLQAIPATLVRYCEPLVRFDELVWGQEEAPVQRLRNVLLTARELYRMVSGSQYRVDANGFGTLRRSPLLKGLVPVTTNAQLWKGEGSVALTAVRLNHDGKKYVTSKLMFHLVEFDPGGKDAETVLFCNTWMKAPRGDEDPKLRLEGYLVPQPLDLYLLLTHKDGAGINVATLSAGDFTDPQRSFCRGLILAAERDRNRGTLASRLAVLRHPNPDRLIGSLTAHQLIEAIGSGGGRRSVGEEIIDFLHVPDHSVLRPPGERRIDPETALDSWKKIGAYVRSEGFFSSAKDSVEVSTYLTKPLIAE